MSYKDIVQHYENCLAKHGDNHRGVDWPNAEDVDKRYRVMYELIQFNNDNSSDVSLLDFGCGTGHFLNYLRNHTNTETIPQYSGLDLSSKFVDVAKSKYPDVQFYCGDILEQGFTIPDFDYIVLNGVFTEKRSLSFDEMWSYFTKMLDVLYPKCSKGLAFNVMSKNVDWERDDLFHLPLDMLANHLCKNLTRDFIIRNDYGLFEYSVYIYKR